MWQAVGPVRIEKMVNSLRMALRGLAVASAVSLAVCASRSTTSWTGSVPSLIFLLWPEGEVHWLCYRAISKPEISLQS